MADSKIINDEVRCTQCGKVFSGKEAECPNCKTPNTRSNASNPNKSKNEKFDEINDAERKKQMSRNKYGPKGLMILFIVLILSVGNSYAQSPQTKPFYRGGTLRIIDWLTAVLDGHNAFKSGIDNIGKGIIQVSFIVAKSGRVKDMRLIKGTSDNSFNDLLISTLSKMPNWSPAITAEGYACEAEVNMSFRFEKEKDIYSYSSWISDSKREWEQLPNHKTYEGEFSAFGLTKEYGKAKYQYIERSDRSRIFDGNFVFVGNNGFYAKGQFKNDYQVGLWEYKSNGREAQINFDNEGYPNGYFVMYKTDNGSTGFPTKFGFKMVRDVCSGKLERGRFVEMKTLTSKGFYVIYYYDAYGDIRDARVTNSSTIKWEKYRGFYHIDNSTGDKESISVGEGTPDRTGYDMSLERCLLRSSAKRTFEYQRK